MTLILSEKDSKNLEILKQWSTGEIIATKTLIAQHMSVSVSTVNNMLKTHKVKSPVPKNKIRVIKQDPKTGRIKSSVPVGGTSKTGRPNGTTGPTGTKQKNFPTESDPDYWSKISKHSKA